MNTSGNTGETYLEVQGGDATRRSTMIRNFKDFRVHLSPDRPRSEGWMPQLEFSEGWTPSSVANWLYEESQLSQDAYFRGRCRKFLDFIAKEYHEFPSALFIDEIQTMGRFPVAGGGFADIYKGMSKSTTGHPGIKMPLLCLKVLRVHVESDERKRNGIISNFCREALVWTRLSHPNIHPLLGVNKVFFEPGFALISPWMENGHILLFIDRNPTHDKLRSIREIATGLEYLHSLNPPVVHGDIKGVNVLVAPDTSCRLADFGLARIAYESTILDNTSSNGRRGSTRWMAPEMFVVPEPSSGGGTLGRGPHAARDIYAYACTVLEIMTGKPPFSELSEGQLIAQVSGGQSTLPRRPTPSDNVWCPDDVWILLGRCWDMNPLGRPTAYDILKYLAELSTSQEAGSTLESGEISTDSYAAPCHSPEKRDERGSYTTGQVRAQVGSANRVDHQPIHSPPFHDPKTDAQSSSTSPAASKSHSDEHRKEPAHAFHNDDHHYDDAHSYDYDYYSSDDYSYTYSDDDGESPDIEISSARLDSDAFIEGSAANPRLIPGIRGGSGSRSTSIRRKGSSMIESHWSVESGYGSFTDIASIWSYGAWSGAEGWQQRYQSFEELGLASGNDASISASGGTHPPSDEDWRRLLGPVQTLGAAGNGGGRPPNMMPFVNSPLDDSFARGLNAWGGQSYQDLRKEWVFRKDRSERSRNLIASTTVAAGSSTTGSRPGRMARQAPSGMPVPSQENWGNYLLGRFLVIREEVGGEAGGSRYTKIPFKSALTSRLKSSENANASESRSGSLKKSAEKGPDNERASLSSDKSSKGKVKRRDENVGEGLAETRSTGNTSEPQSGLKSYKLNPSLRSQPPTSTPKPLTITEYANVNTRQPQQRLVIRKINGKARERASRQKTEAKAPSMTGSSAPQIIAEYSTSSPLSNESAFQSPANPPELSLYKDEPSIPVGEPTSLQHPTLSSRDLSHSKISKQSHAPFDPNMLSHPLGYDPLHPAVVIHKHSKVAAFSFSRHHRSSWAHVSPPARSKTVIMLAQRSVQEAFTTTETIKRFQERIHSMPLPSAAAAANEGNKADPQPPLCSKQSCVGDRPNLNLDTISSTTHTRRMFNSSLLKHLIPFTNTLRGSSTSKVTSSSSSNTLVESTTSSGSVISSAMPPKMTWTFPTRDQQEMHWKEGATGKLKRLGDKEKDKEKDRGNNVLDCVPPESLFMLLPLWPGETDPYAHRYFPFNMPPVPLEERMFLLVYYKPLSEKMLATMDINPRTTFSPIQDKRNILLPYFHIIARQVSHTELRDSGVRLPDQGLAVSGPLEEAFNTAPRLQSQPSVVSPPSPSSAQISSLPGIPVRDFLMGSCYSRDSGIEFNPEVLLELGLCSILKEEDVLPNPLPPGKFKEESERPIAVKLTAVGSAVVEMAWAGGLALTSFSPVEGPTKS
ncbi:hypothetical protein V5O48_005962 [Marasmius crinis-equi]|uniref:Protein kinase domain-containing protein n=1 Tax=Marasmius crinis-equi TaxID=585013 RepID=A0ABR3FLG2_9AGAR